MWSGQFGPPVEESKAEWQRIRHALDSVGSQRDCYASHLFWYTNLEEAKDAARAANKPILSLRLLGKLTDEFSCANSRFFRATLYSNPRVAAMLRDRFVLHWQTVRPAPIVTIDFGDGRKLLRTVTGNSAHYVLAADGQPLDALPGLYGPQAFMTCLERAETLARSVNAKGADRRALVAQYHRERTAALDRAWELDLQRLGLPVAIDQVRNGDFESRPVPPEDPNHPIWQRIAVLHAGAAQLDPASRRLIASHHPTANEATVIAAPKGAIESPLVRLARELQGTIALDTVRNEYVLHRQVHEWFAAGTIGDLDGFNERVYAELFLTPSSDPWLGLLPEAYTGLEDDGVVAANP